MHLIQIFLPLHDNGGKGFPSSHYLNIREEMTRRFGGLTAFTRAPAEGLWKDETNRLAKDDIVIFEVMIPELDETWWRAYKQSLERLFAQDEIVIRVQSIALL